ncbi:hypothetical protein VUG52_01630 [Pseudomonas sp. LH21]|uniref:hypothetical protein n=1 Tax=Pseudomonas sp. LH21 TaxID=3114884 RepID=UPI002F937917
MGETLDWFVVVWNLAAPATPTVPNKATDWSTVGVALITAFAGIGGTYLTAARQSKAESRSVRAAIIAEVLALVELFQRRSYLKTLRSEAEALKTPRPINFKVTCKINLPEHYNRIYQENAKRLGSLSSIEAAQVVRFYQLIDSLRSDVTEGGVLFNGTVDAQHFESAAEVLSAALEVGNAMTLDRKSWWRG